MSLRICFAAMAIAILAESDTIVPEVESYATVTSLPPGEIARHTSPSNKRFRGKPRKRLNLKPSYDDEVDELLSENAEQKARGKLGMRKGKGSGASMSSGGGIIIKHRSRGGRVRYYDVSDGWCPDRLDEGSYCALTGYKWKVNCFGRSGKKKCQKAGCLRLYHRRRKMSCPSKCRPSIDSCIEKYGDARKKVGTFSTSYGNNFVRYQRESTSSDTPKLQWIPRNGHDTWYGSQTVCRNLGKRLCKKDEVCAGTHVKGGTRHGDCWIAVQGGNNWLQVGQSPPRPSWKCKLHQQIARKRPNWGGHTYYYPFRRWLACC